MKKLLLIAVLFSASFASFAQYHGHPTYHDDYSNLYIMGGYQYLSHPTGVYQVGTVQAEILFSFFSSRIGFAVGPEYTSFSPFGIFLFAPRIFASTLEDQASNPALLAFMLIAVSAGQWRFPLTDHIEINFGWDALKFTKLKNYHNTYYITGSLNAGLTCFLGDMFFVSGYYEYNHPHNTAIGIVNWMFEETVFSSQPDILKGHSFGVRAGWMF